MCLEYSLSISHRCVENSYSTFAAIGFLYVSLLRVWIEYFYFQEFLDSPACTLAEDLLAQQAQENFSFKLENESGFKRSTSHPTLHAVLLQCLHDSTSVQILISSSNPVLSPPHPNSLISYGDLGIWLWGAWSWKRWNLDTHNGGWHTHFTALL